MRNNMYLGNVENKEDIAREFQIEATELDGCKIIFAAYTYEDYSGSALVIYQKGDKLYEVNGSHCSCNGLEGQWEPEETSFEVLKIRNVSHYGFSKPLEELFVDVVFERDVLLI